MSCVVYDIYNHVFGLDKDSILLLSMMFFVILTILRVRESIKNNKQDGRKEI